MDLLEGWMEALSAKRKTGSISMPARRSRAVIRLAASGASKSRDMVPNMRIKMFAYEILDESVEHVMSVSENHYGMLFTRV